MSTQNTIWVIINCQAAVDQIRERLANGAFSEINSLLSYLKSFEDKLQSMAQKAGGHVYVMLYERMVLEIPITLAEQIPDMVIELKDKLGPDVSCGLGLDYEEANRACVISSGTGRIEMYGEDTQKSDSGDPTPFELPPNLFNPEMQRTVNNPVPDKHAESKTPVLRPALQQDLQMDAEYIQALSQTMGAGQQPQQPQQGQGQEQGQEGEEGPRDLLEALNGGPVDGHQPEEDEDKEGSDKESSESEGEPEEKDEMSGDETDSKLANSLLNIRDRIPELITLQERNPEAFKQSMAMIQKLIGLARSRKKSSAKKSEMDQINGKLDELTKKIQMRYPVGTRKGRKIKVIIDGKAVWRSMSAGRVQDAKGQAISVKSHNAAAESGSQGEQK